MQLFVFDPRCGSEEDADKKILFFHPPDTPINEQVSSVGLCEAIAAFSSAFSSEGCESLHTQQGRLLSLQCEPSYWIVLHVPHTPGGQAVKPSSGGSASPAAPASALSPRMLSSPASSSKEAAAGSDEFLPPSEEALQDCSLQALIRRIYGALRLACGPLSEVAAARGVDGLRALLAEVLPPLLRVCIPAGEEDGKRLDLLDTLEGMRFLVTDRWLYMRVQFLLNLVITSQPCVQHAMLLHAEHLVWSSLSRDATLQLHRAVAHVVAPSLQIPTRNLQAFPPSSAAALPDEALLFAIGLIQRQLRSVAKAPPAAGCFVCGAGDVTQDARSAVRVPCVHIEPQPGSGPSGSGGGEGEAEGGVANGTSGGESGSAAESSGAADATSELRRLRLVVFQLQQASVVLLVDEASPNWSQPLWYQQVAALLVPELQPVAGLLAETHAKLQAVDEAHRYIYFNRLNLVLKSSIRAMRAGLTGRLGLHTEPKHLLNRVHADLVGEHGVREVALQTAGAHGWLVGQASNSRGFYLLLDGRECSWSEVHQEVQALCATRFANIFLEG